MGSDSVNRFLISLSTLLISSIVVIHGTEAKYQYKRSSEVPQPPDSKNDLNLSTPEECNRECVRGEQPKICYYRFVLEFYTVLGGACDLCTPNEINSGNCSQCVTADGVERVLLTVNRMFPGPSIQVCLGDKVVIDLVNRMPGIEITIHWHGILQKGSQYYDGVPYLTQCPIPYGNTFRYQWHANNEGTHFWHGHDGMHKMDGIHGSLIIRVPPFEDPNSILYDFDLPKHVILVADWMHEFTSEHFPGLKNTKPGQLPDSFLFNGKGKYTDPLTGISTNTSLEVFTVKSGSRYRFRFINSCCSTCPIIITFEKHTPILISVDGTPVEPEKIGSMITVAGERIDFVINADQTPKSYWILLRALGECVHEKLYQLAILRYEEDLGEPSSAEPTYDMSLPTGVVLGPLDGICNTTRDDGICISQLNSGRPVDSGILQPNPDFTFFYEVNFQGWDPEVLYRSGTYHRFSVPSGSDGVIALVNNITYESPTSPLLSQIKDNPKEKFCNKDNRPENCGDPCMCTHMIHIPKDSIVEFILTDGVGVPELSHPIHMHGYTYNVMCMGKSPDQNVTRMRADHVRYLDRNHYIRRNFHQPPFKDTVAIPTGGYVVLRFRADNPGFWLMHCHFLYHQLIGMEMILHVGEICKDLPPVPPNFPVCGNHLPPIEPNSY